MNQAIRVKAAELASDAASPREVSQRIAQFVRDDIPYYLDEWDIPAEEVLHKKRGMCAGKALLVAELHCAVAISVRFKVLKILGEEGLFDFVLRRLEETAGTEPSIAELESVLGAIHSLPPQRDHIIVQVFVDGKWVELDVARDGGLDRAACFVGIQQERKLLREEGPYDSISGWLEARMRQRTVTEHRHTFFQVINHQMEKLRQVGQLAERAGLQSWSEAETRQSLHGWDIIPGCPTGTGAGGSQYLDELATKSRTDLSRFSQPTKKGILEEGLVTWLYHLVRHNIKRGRIWELSQVLTQQRADCLGYARLMAFLATDFGLKAGVVEVVTDNRGRYVPHCVCLVNLTDGRRRLIDPWYGSADVRHRLIIARVKEAGRLVVKQFPVTESIPEVCGLAPEHLAGLSLYIRGNAYLARGRNGEAVECYHASLWLYPENPRTLFNRAVAFDRMSEGERAQADYQRALSIESSLARIVATTDDIEPLIELDEKGITEDEQQIYLHRQGFVTGQEAAWAEIARRCGTTPDEAQAKFNSVVARLTYGAGKVAP